MQRKSTKQSRGPNAAEKHFQSYLKSMPCAVGGHGITEVHHCKGSTFKHNKVLIGHWFCIPLSQSKHAAYHSGTKSWQDLHGHQAEIWAEVYANYAAGFEGAMLCPDQVYESIVSLIHE